MGLGRDPIEDLHQHLLLLLHARREVDDLRDVLVRVERVDVADLHLHRVAQELVREGADGARPRRRVEERLPLLRDAAADDLADLRLEAHVEHAVGLVEYKEAASVERDHATRHEVLG